MEELQSILDYCGSPNLAGLLKIEYVPTAYVFKPSFERLLSSTHNQQQDLQFTQGGWLTAPVLPEKKNWTENQREDKQQPFYDQRCQGTTPKLRAAVTGEFEKMAHHRYLLRLTDRDGKKWLLGDLESPFVFSAAAKSGTGAGLNSYKIQFLSKTRFRAVGFVPVF